MLVLALVLILRVVTVIRHINIFSRSCVDNLAGRLHLLLRSFRRDSCSNTLPRRCRHSSQPQAIPKTIRKKKKEYRAGKMSQPRESLTKSKAVALRDLDLGPGNAA